MLYMWFRKLLEVSLPTEIVKIKEKILSAKSFISESFRTCKILPIESRESQGDSNHHQNQKDTRRPREYIIMLMISGDGGVEE